MPLKKYSSRLLRTIAQGYITFPILFPIISTLIYEVPANKWVHVFLSPLFYLVCMISVAAGWGLREMKRWAWYVAIVANVFIIYYNALVAAGDGVSPNRGMAFLGLSTFLVVLLVRVSREVRVPYFFPRIRWWESNPRYKLCLSALVKRPHNDEWLEADILDISQVGCFLKLGYDTVADEPVEIDFKAYGLEFHLQCRLVWKTLGGVTLPKGVGAKFVSMSRGQKKKLKLLVQHLERIKSLNLKKRYILTNEEFEKQLEALQNSYLIESKTK